MSGWKVTLAVAAALVVVVLLFFGIGYVSANNREVGLRNQVGAQAKVCETSHDNMWKIIKGKAEVAETERSSFEKIAPQIISGRYQDNNLLFKFVKEHNPRISQALYKSLVASIEAERHRFLKEQAKLVDLKRQHDDVRTKWPSSMFVGSRPEIAITVVTSTRTAEAFSTGTDDDASVFSKKEPAAKQ